MTRAGEKSQSEIAEPFNVDRFDHLAHDNRGAGEGIAEKRRVDRDSAAFVPGGSVASKRCNGAASACPLSTIADLKMLRELNFSPAGILAARDLA
jgi:hypothetical protein